MSKKVTCVVSACPDTYSGYGRRSLDFIKQLLLIKPDWDIKILSQRWGDTRMGFLEDSGEWEVLSRVVPGVDKKPDVWIQITVPNEFQPVGRYNIGVTAAIETTLCDPSWIEGCNRMDLVLVSSEHGKRSIADVRYTNQANGAELKLVKPMEVLFEGIDTDIYFKQPEPKKAAALKDLKNSWNFLCVGHWLQGNFGEDRKNIAYTIKAFLETFKDVEQAPGLILKTSHATTSYIDQDTLIDQIYDIRETVAYKKSLPNIYLLHGDLTDQEINEVYNDPRVKALVSLTKGEGYGRPLAEFATIGKPIMVSGWSGHLDFLKEKGTVFVGGKLDKVHPSAVQPHMILAEASWFRPDDTQVVAGFREIYKNYSKWLVAAEQQAKTLRITKNLGAMGARLEELLDQYVSIPVEINLPKELM